MASDRRYDGGLDAELQRHCRAGRRRKPRLRLAAVWKRRSALASASESKNGLCGAAVVARGHAAGLNQTEKGRHFPVVQRFGGATTCLCGGSGISSAWGRRPRRPLAARRSPLATVCRSHETGSVFVTLMAPTGARRRAAAMQGAWQRSFAGRRQRSSAVAWSGAQPRVLPDRGRLEVGG